MELSVFKMCISILSLCIRENYPGLMLTGKREKVKNGYKIRDILGIV